MTQKSRAVSYIFRILRAGISEKCDRGDVPEMAPGAGEVFHQCGRYCTDCETKWKDDFTRETVNGKPLREGIAEAILEVMLSDGSTLQMSVDTEGNYFYTSSREPTRKYTITPDKLSQLLLQ